MTINDNRTSQITRLLTSVRRLRCAVLTLAAAAVLLAASPAAALITSKGPNGTNHAKAHVAPHASIGNFVPVGVLEIGGRVDTTKTTIDNDGRLIKNFNFIGVAGPYNADPAPGGPVTDHATQVADIIGSSHATYTGVAPGTRLYVGGVQSDAEIFDATVYYNTSGLAGIFNYSLGGSAFGQQSLRNHTGVQAILNAAGSSTNITTNPFNFTMANFQSIDELAYSFIVNDADHGPGEFDNGNLRLNIGGVLISPFNATIATNGSNIVYTGTVRLTPAQTQTLTTSLNGNAGNVHIQLQRIADLNDTDSGDNSGNRVTPTNGGGAGQQASLILRQSNNDGATKLAMALDWFATSRDSLPIVAAGNDGNFSGQVGTPGDLWNGMSVGALNTNFTARANFSDFRQSSGTGKPNIVAPGENIWTEFIPGSNGKGNGTSFAAPHVTGIAALLEAGTENSLGLALGLPGNNRHLATKAIIMNSARKRFTIAPENGAYLDIQDNAATNAEAADGDYLDGGLLRDGGTVGSPKTASWTPAHWTYDEDNNSFSTSDPLDDELGAGLADAERALIQLDGGQQGPGNVMPIGWHIGSVPNSSFVDYVLDFPVRAGDFITTTLDWDRIINRTDDGDGLVDFADTFTAGAVPDLDLFLMYKNNPFAASEGFTDVVEHLHIPFMKNGAAGDYVIRVYSGFTTTPTSYGLAWWTTAVPEPGTATLLVFAFVLLLPRHRRSWR